MLLLCIDTSTEVASVSLVLEGNVLAWSRNELMKDHAGWIHTAIGELFSSAGKSLKDLDSVAVAEGPGSYTGLRVGMATAKGLCFALGIPLITESSLKIMAQTAILNIGILPNRSPTLYCPMIDARRMEVFTSVYDDELKVVMPSTAMILAPDSFSDLAVDRSIIFFGNGTPKFKELTHNPNFIFKELDQNPRSLAFLGYQKYLTQQFANLAYSEPAYIKEFYTHTPK